jgi:hypothetical protein
MQLVGHIDGWWSIFFSISLFLINIREINPTKSFFKIQVVTVHPTRLIKDTHNVTHFNVDIVGT